VLCLISVRAGSFDRDLLDNEASDGLISPRVVWGVVLLVVTTAVGLLAAARARQLYRRPNAAVLWLADPGNGLLKDVRICRDAAAR
jgi:hypothetical protein